MSKTILVIDDEGQMRELLRQFLIRAGYEVHVAEDGVEGLKIFEEVDKIDAVITDLLMPNKEGLETIMELKAKDPNIRIVATSGGGQGGMLNFLPAAEQLGASASISKPFDRRELLDLLEKVLRD